QLHESRSAGAASRRPMGGVASVTAPRGKTALQDQFESIGITCGSTSLIAIDTFWTHASLYSPQTNTWAELPHPDVAIEGDTESWGPEVTSTETLPSLRSRQWTGSMFVWWSPESTMQLIEP